MNFFKTQSVEIMNAIIHFMIYLNCISHSLSLLFALYLFKFLIKTKLTCKKSLNIIRLIIQKRVGNKGRELRFSNGDDILSTSFLARNLGNVFWKWQRDKSDLL